MTEPVSFVLQNLALDLNDCTTILQAELEVVLPDGTVESVPMQLGRPEDAPAGVDSVARDDCTRLRVEASEDWWSDWLRVPEEGFEVQARVILGDGEEARVGGGHSLEKV